MRLTLREVRFYPLTSEGYGKNCLIRFRIPWLIEDHQPSEPEWQWTAGAYEALPIDKETEND